VIKQRNGEFEECKHHCVTTITTLHTAQPPNGYH